MTILAACISVVLALICLDFVIGGRRIRMLERILPRDDLPLVSIVVPARNEARGVETAVTSLLHLDYPRLELIALDDRSSDGTGDILDRVARADPRLRVIHVTELPSGWLGKNHAMAVGAAAARGEYVLFTDADVVFERTVLKRAVTLMKQNALDHLAAIPEVRVPGIALNAFVAAFGVFFLLYARPWSVPNPRSRHHIGIGAFNLLRTSVYQAIGTHQAIAMRPDDDMKLGKLVKKHGFRQEAVLTGPLLLVEWYSTLPEAVNGLMKNAFAGVGYRLTGVIGSTLSIGTLFVWPFIGALVTTGATRAFNVLSVAFIVLIFAMTSRGRPMRTLYVLAFPFSALLFTYVVWRSALRALIRGRVEWRGTEYSLSEMRANRV